MSKTTLTDIVFLLDRSGSMSSIADDMVGGFKAFMDEQRQAGQDAVVSLYQFDNRFQEVFVEKPLADVGPLSLVPRGTTALLDSMAQAIAETRARIEAKPVSQRPTTVIFGIITDGMENASKEVTREAVRTLVERQEAIDEWTFLYLGANQDAIAVGRGLGISPERSMTYSTDNVEAAMSAMSHSVHAMRMARDVGLDMMEARSAAAYRPKDRDAAVADS